MVPLGILLAIVISITADVLIRQMMERQKAQKLLAERQAALESGLRLVFAEEAVTLKRVEAPQPKARILAVDDEDIILGSLRKILALAGYSIDTVQSGPEALTLLKKHEYDFVFTDLKMPQMDGVEVTKAVKHLRPDVDVIVITGFATIETAVETMKYGALDYVQKPFTEDELVDLVNKSLIRRLDRLEKSSRPRVHLVTAASGESTSSREYNVPAGFFVAPEHTWVKIEPDGRVRIGVDDFAQKILGPIEAVQLPQVGQKVNRGQTLFACRQGQRSANLAAPLSGAVTAVNDDLAKHADAVKQHPYEAGWICLLEPDSLAEELSVLKIGNAAVKWYQEEIERFAKIIQKSGVPTDTLDDEQWNHFTRSFLYT